MNYLSKTIAVFTVGIMFSMGFLSLNAQAENAKQIAENLQTLSEVSKADPSNAILETLVSQDSQTIESKQGDLELEIDLKDKTITIKQNDSEDTEISLPENLGLKNGQKIGDSVVFDGNNVDVVVQTVGGGIRQILNIDSSKAGNSFNFPLGLKNEETAEILPEGSVAIRDKDGELVTSILKPWAKDKNNKELKTYYTINDDILTQHIDYTDAVFPVSADPTWCGDMISHTYWQKFQKTSWSLAVIPTWCGRIDGASWNLDSAWKEVLDKTDSCGKYELRKIKIGRKLYNQKYCKEIAWDESYGSSIYWSMYDQFDCHHSYVIAAVLESEYNLEINRKNVGIGETLKSKCNPVII